MHEQEVNKRAWTSEKQKCRVKMRTISSVLAGIYKCSGKCFPYFLHRYRRPFPRSKMTTFLTRRAKHLLLWIRLSECSHALSCIRQGRKNPAVAAAGQMTRKSFRRLVQEETVSSGESTRLGARVSTPLARYIRLAG